MRSQKRVSGNQPVFRAIKCISKSFKAFLRSETIDIDFFAPSFCFNQWNSSPFILLVSKLSVWGSREKVTKQQHVHSVESLRWRWSTSNIKMTSKPEFNPPYWVSKSPWFPLAWPPRNSQITHALFLFRGRRAPHGLYWRRAQGVRAPRSIRSPPRYIFYMYIFYTCKIYHKHSQKLTEYRLCTGYLKGAV